MANPVCLSPLKFYDDIAKQSHRKSYAHGHISPLLTKIHRLPPFQFIIPSWLYAASGSIDVYNIITGKYLENNTGTIQENIHYFITENIPVQLGDRFIFKYSNYNTNVYSIYNSNNEQIAYRAGTSASGSFDTIEVEITQALIDAGASYIIFCCRKNYLDQYYLKKIKGNLTASVFLLDARTDEIVGNNRFLELNAAGFNIDIINRYTVAKFKPILNHPVFTDVQEGLYYLKLASVNDTWAYYSEVFCFTEVTQDLIEIEYWNETGDFNIKNGIVSFADNFHFKLLLKSELGKPEYSFEEESTKRLGYVFIESQVSKKVHKFNTVVPEFICDAMRLIRLCDNKLIRSLDEEYDAMSFEMEAEWQTQGDLASVNCEFETDNVVVNLGGFIPDRLGGDFNDDHNSDFDNQ